MSKHALGRRGLTGVVAGALVATPLVLGLTGSPANAAGPGLVISEAYLNGGSAGAAYTHKYVEIYNSSDAPITLAGKSVQYRSATGTGAATSKADLTGTLAPGDFFLVQGGQNTGGGGVPVPNPDAVVPGLNPGGGGGTFFIADGTTLVNPASITPIDKVGWGNSNTPEGTAASTASATTSIQRNAAGADTDVNSADFAAAVPTPGAPNGTSTGALAASNPGNQTATVDQPIAPITLAATGGSTPYTWAVEGLPAGLSATPAGVISGTPTATGSSNVTATVTDSASATASTSFTITVSNAAAITPIAEIQGTDTATSPLSGQSVTTEGVVTAMYRTGGYNGMYVQTGGTGGGTDATPGASDAIFVYGSNSMPAGVAIGDSVRVTGPVSEFQGTTEITPASGGVTKLAEPLSAVTPAAIDFPATDAAKEAHEGELLAPKGAFTVSNVYNIDGGANAFAEIGLAAGTKPLIQPTDVADAQTGDIAGVAADNKARQIALDDGSSLNLMTAANTGLPLPWVTNNANPPRMGAPVTFTGGVILEYRNNLWKFQPTSQITGDGSGTATFGVDRSLNATPANVGGDLKLATFNVLNYFPTTGEDHVAAAAGNTCAYYLDRQGNPIAVNSNPGCNNNGPRGAANDANLQRQQSKIVNAINGLGADVVSLEEIENSVKMTGQTDRDNAVRTLVEALNADAGSTRWAFAPSPAAADLPSLSEQDVIRTAFIYNPDTVELVGASKVLVGEPAFNNAREPLAQAFKPKGASDDQAFGAIVNHFKSKGSGTDDGTGQGNANPDRIAQATALATFAESFATERGVEAMFLLGDFNSYTQEDPMQVLYGKGYTNVESDDETDASYSFDGLSGSLDHVLANDAALGMVTGSDIWEINANESLAYQYSRYNYHGAITFDGDSPWSSSDHNPEIIGLSPDGAAAATRDIQILGTNDFHGRLENNPTGTEAGAAVLAGAVKQFRAQNPDTVFAAAGDLVGATTFTSFIQNDKPTIDALNEAGLDVSAAGNHEFDQGYDDLINRIMSPTAPDGGAEWTYISSNLKLRDSGDPALDPSFVKTFGDVEVGFVGAVTEELPSLVSPAGIADIEVEPIVSSVNAEADKLKAEGVDVIVLLVHEGAASPALADSTNPGSPFGKIVNGVDENIDAIISGHTHQAYDHSIPVPEWVAEGRAVTERPVVSSGQYGSNLNRLVFTVDEATGEVTAKTQEFVRLKTPPVPPATTYTPNYPADPATAQIVADAVAEAAPLGAVPLGTIAGPFSRAKFGDGARENRGGESTLGNLVAEVQRWATEKPESGSAQIALMNPGGLRADMVGNPGDFPRTLTYKQAADVQPFANTLVNMSLTGAQLETVLEQQWQLNSSGVVPSRPFLKLGVSEGFEYTYTTAPQPTPNPDDGDATYTQGEITSMTLNGEPIVDGQSYSVTVNSFLATGGDNFRELAKGSGARDTGKVDLQAMVDYMAEFAAPGGDPLPVDYSQRAVGVTAVDSPVTAGTSVSFDLTSLIMTGAVGTAPNQILDAKDNEVTVTLDGELLGGFPVDQTITNPGTGSGEADKASSDEFGKASVAVTIPATTTDGAHDLVIKGEETGTEITVPITVEGGVPAQVDTTTSVTVSPAKAAVKKDKSTFKVTVSASGYTPTGKVEIFQGGKVVGSGTLAADGTVSIAAGPWPTVGTLPVVVRYLGDARAKASETSTTVTVVKQTPTIKAKAKPATVKKGKATTVTVTLKGVNAKVTGKVKFKIGKKTVTRKVTNGKAVLKIKKVTKRTKVKVTYLGDANFAKASTKVIVKVKR